jgi:hypothetical protein
MNFEDSWTLGSIVHDEDWIFARPNKIANPPKKLMVEVSSPGVPTDFTHDTRTTIIGTGGLASLFPENEVQLIPVQFKGLKTEEPYYAIVVLNDLECIDEKESDYEIWEEGNSIRPDLAGKYKGFFKMKVKKDLNTPLSIFRVNKFGIAIIVNETIKKNATLLGLTGMRFEKV